MLNRNIIAAVRACALVLPVATMAPMAATAAEPIKIGFPIPLSGPTAVYGEPILKGAQIAIEDINAAGGVLGRKLELLQRDSKANPAEAVRLARELIVRDGVEFLAGTLTSAEAPAVEAWMAGTRPAMTSEPAGAPKPANQRPRTTPKHFQHRR